MNVDDQQGMRELALFAGAGGGILGGRLLGWRTVCAVELDKYARRVLVARQNDGCLDPFPIWDDVSTFDGKPWRGRVDVVSGGFPCQDISVAGKGEGITGKRSGLWGEMSRIIREVRPRFAFVENSAALTARGLGVVLGDLAALGYDAAWGVFGAHHFGAPHKRDRIWIVARMANAGGARAGDLDCEIRDKAGQAVGRDDTPLRQGNGQERANRINATSNGSLDFPDSTSAQCEGRRLSVGVCPEHAIAGVDSWWRAEPSVGRVANALAYRVDRLKAIGNGQVPIVAAGAFMILREELERRIGGENRA